MIELSEDEVKIITHIRNLQWGKIEIAIKDGKPVMISLKEDIKFDKTV